MNTTTELSRCSPAAPLTNSTTEARTPRLRPVYRAKDEGSAYAIRVELPGVEKEDVTLSFEDDTLAVKASRRANQPDTWQTLYRETTDRDYALDLRFEAELDAEAISAALADGILTVTLPKAAAAQRRSIAIQ